MRDLDQSYYLSAALQAMETAHANNHDSSVGPYISRAIDALHRLMYQTPNSGRVHQQPASDPYEMNDFNSAV